MGGGVGVSIHGKFRVCTEKTLFAKPETGIGLFPDVGASHFLAEMPGATGEYIALTGARLKANDLMYSDLSTHFIQSELIPSLYDSLGLIESIPPLDDVDQEKERRSKLEKEVCSVLDSYQRQSNINVNDGIFGRHRSTIDMIFSQSTMEEIMTSLDATASSSSSSSSDKDEDEETRKFAADTLKTLQGMSPTSL